MQVQHRDNYWGHVKMARPLVEQNTKTSPEGMSFVYLTSLDWGGQNVRAGVVIEASLELAAERIADRTHTFSTEAEIAKYHADQTAREAICAEITRKNQEKSVMAMPPDLANLVSVLTANAISSQPGQKPKGKEN